MASNEYFDSSGYPSTGAAGTSAAMRAELDAIEEGFKKLPTLSGNNNKIVVVNSGGSSLESKSAEEVKALMALDNVDNTADLDKPISTAVQTALNLKAPLASPTFTGVPSGPTAAAGTNTTQFATTAFVKTLGDTKANINSPTFTGTPSGPTPANTDDSTKFATTAWVKNVIVLYNAQTGYEKSVDGYVKQWGYVQQTGSGVSTGGITGVGFSIAFTNLWGIHITNVGGTGYGSVYGTPSTTGFTLFGLQGSYFYWEAYGYIPLA